MIAPMPDPLLALPGLGADARLFTPQQRRFSHLRVPAWPTPERQDDVRTFAGRLLDRLVAEDLWRPETTLLGFSFGGQVALSMTRLAIEQVRPQPRAIVLVSAPRTDVAITKAFRTQVALSRFVPSAVMRFGARRVVGPRFARACGLDAAQTPELLAMAEGLDVAEFRALSRIASRWSFSADDEARIRDVGVRIAHAHSKLDPVIPAPPVDTPDVDWIEARAHLLTWTHADLVGDLVARALLVEA